jgi:hybrid cluster-associated redox disulfide protein
MISTDSANSITADTLVWQVFERHPQTIIIFAHHGLQCVGCYISHLHTIADSAREHAIALGPLLGDLNQAIGRAGGRAGECAQNTAE